MSGHSKWSTIKRKKGALDAKRGKIFSKLAKEISVAARLGGGDPEMNPRLRTVLLAARSENMPKENVERAIKKGTGEIEGVNYEEQRYECYGPAGVGIVVETLTDNKNRIVAEVRHIVSKHGGSMAEANAVMWNFASKGRITVEKAGLTEEDIFEKAIEAGAEDVDVEGDMYEIITDLGDLHAVASALEAMKIEYKEAKPTLIPKTTLEVDGKALTAMLKILDALEENDDVQDVYTNIEFSDAALEAAMAD